MSHRKNPDFLLHRTGISRGGKVSREMVESELIYGVITQGEPKSPREVTALCKKLWGTRITNLFDSLAQANKIETPHVWRRMKKGKVMVALTPVDPK